MLYRLFCSSASALFPLSVKLIWMPHFCLFLKHIFRVSVMESLEVLSLPGHPLLLSNLTCYLGDENIIQQREMLLRANSLLSETFFPKYWQNACKLWSRAWGDGFHKRQSVFFKKLFGKPKLSFTDWKITV